MPNNETVMKRRTSYAREYGIQEHNDKKINLRMHENFNMVQSIMSISTDAKESFYNFLKHRIQY